MATPRKLGLFMLTTLVTGNMIGSGIFMLPASLANIGTISLYSWLFTASGAILMAILFASIAYLYPHKTGGPYLFAAEAFGPFVGSQTAYCYWSAAWIGNAATSLAAMGYLSYFIPWLKSGPHACAGAITLIWILTCVNMWSVHHAGKFQSFSTVLKLLPILAIGSVGWFYVHPEYYEASFNVSGDSDFHAFSAACTLTLWTFLGLESGTVVAESVERPKRNIPLATLLGAGIAVVVYIASSTALMGMVPNEVLRNSTAPFAEAADLIFGPIGGTLIAAGAFISAAGTLNGWILIQGQVAQSAAENGYFPEYFKKKSGPSETPVRALLISSLLMTGLLLLSISPSLVKQFDTVILMATLSSLFPYFYTSVGYVILLKKQGQKIKFRHIFMGILASAYALWMVYGAGEAIVFYGTLLVLMSIPVYAVCLFQKNGK